MVGGGSSGVSGLSVCVGIPGGGVPRNAGGGVGGGEADAVDEGVMA